MATTRYSSHRQTPRGGCNNPFLATTARVVRALRSCGVPLSGCGQPGSCRWRYTTPLWLWVLFGAPAIVRSDESAVLTAAGLVRQGNLWVLGDEANWLAQVAHLRPLEKSASSAEQQYQAALAANEQRFAELEQLRKQVRELQRLAASSDVSRRTKLQLAEQVRVNQELIRGLEREVADPREADRAATVRKSLIEWIDRRATLAEALLADRSQAKSLAQRYAALASDPGILVALGDTATRRRLGPSRTFEIQAASLDKLSAALFSDIFPVYRDHGLWRVNVVLEERAARTLNFSPEGTEHLLTASLLEAAEIKVDPQAPEITIQTSGGRAVRGRRIELAKLRIGNRVLTKVPAIALSPEGEDLGSVLGGKALTGYRLEIDRARLQAKVLSGAAEPADAGADASGGGNKAAQPAN